MLALQAPEEVPSGRSEVSELQLMADNQSSLEVTEQQQQQHKTQLPLAGWQRGHTKNTQSHKVLSLFSKMCVFYLLACSFCSTLK